MGLLAAVFTAVSPAPTQNAIANGDTRTINLYHTHTGESISATFRVDGQYDRATLDKLNWFLRDWRTDEPIKMSPKLFDVIWETYRETGSRAPVQIVSAYRSPGTNAMLRRRSRAVAEHSQHMLGKAMDMHYTDVSMSKVREIAMKLQRGGVGYYPTAGTPFVHLDVGSVRAWPRMSYDQLARLFPDGKTVHLPTNGHPLARYEEARAEIEARGDGPSTAVASSGSSRGFFASLFGRGGDEDEAAPAPTRSGRARLARVTPADSEEGASIDTPSQRRGAETLARAERDLPRGETTMGTPVQTASAAADPAGGSRLNMPLPPRRPSELAPVMAAAGPDIPLPPVRPMALAALTAPAAAKANGPATGKDPFTGLLARAADLPDVIKQGTDVVATGSTNDLGLMAYAPAANSDEPVRPALRGSAARISSPAIAQAVGVRSGAKQRKAQLVAARLDRSNFVAFTRPGDMTRTMPQSQLGSATGLRAASQVDTHALVFSAAAPLTTQFGASATDLDTQAFSGPAVRPLLRTGQAGDGKRNRVGLAALNLN
ncbi:MAG: hypothetical protein JWM36_369 [Hyphomicrobiales bacterium]|nr:hypothetical protein [Hyphomicrobiales bacterium]